ncbi:unnamed protein product, partial [Mesorhabditis spiculigera]
MRALHVPCSLNRGGPPARRRSRSASPRRSGPDPAPRKTSPARRLCVRHLSRNVTKEHLAEIFGIYGDLKACELPTDRHQNMGRGYGYVEYDTPDAAEKALKHMDGGQIDGQVVSVEATLGRRDDPPPRARSPIRRRSPPPRRSPIRRSRSPAYRKRSPPGGPRGTGGNTIPLGNNRMRGHRSRSRS